MPALTLPSLAEVDAYPVPKLLVPRIMKLYNRDRVFAEAIVREAKRMMYLTQVSGEPICPSVEIDDAWHEMILFTPFYHKFCQFLGTPYIHHDPTEPEPDEISSSHSDSPSGPNLYDRTLANYAKYIGEPDRRYWSL